MTPVKIDPATIIGLCVALALGIVIAVFGNTVAGWKEKADSFDTAKAQAGTTVGVIADGAKADEGARKVDDAVGIGHTEYQGEMQEARNDAPTRVVLDTGVPPRVSDALRKRRLARERSGGVPGEHGEDAR